MPDGSWVGQVNIGYVMRTEENAELAVIFFRTNSDAFASESHRHFPQSAFEADVVFGRQHGPDDLALVVVGLRGFVRHRAGAWAIAVGRHLVGDALVRTLEIIDVSPAIESALDRGLVGEAFEGEHLLVERAVKALVLASTLRMVGPAVDDV